MEKGLTVFESFELFHEQIVSIFGKPFEEGGSYENLEAYKHWETEDVKSALFMFDALVLKSISKFAFVNKQIS